MIDVDGDMKTKCVCQNLVKISSLKAAFFSEILLNTKKKNYVNSSLQIIEIVFQWQMYVNDFSMTNVSECFWT